MAVQSEIGVRHHSRLLRYRSPQGAVRCGETVTFAVDTFPPYTAAEVTLRLWVQGREVRIPMAGIPFDEGMRFSARVEMSAHPGLIWYYFILQLPGQAEICYGANSGEGALYPHEPPGYQITVYDAAFTTPRWFREGILYQIFPDRFYRGEAGEERLEYHREKGRTLYYHKNWNELPAYLPRDGEEHYAPNDFYCGTLRGIQEKLPYLKSLGVSCIYLNPIFESASNHRYDTGDYRKVDPILGTAEDLKALTNAAKDLGMRLMLDGVFSHTGDDSLYFNKYGRYPGEGAYQSETSPYRSWYSFGDYPPIGYRSWWGFPKLPEVEEMEESYRTFICEGEDDLLTHWANHGVTSWRLDVADELPDAFIKSLRKKLKALDPESVLLGEVWEDASTKEAYGVRREYVLGYELDSVMNYPFQQAVTGFLLGQIDAFALNERLQMLRERYPKPFWYAAMNLLSTHDSIRAATVLGGAPHRDALTREEQAVFALPAQQEALGKQRLVLATAMQMAMPGVPSIYYGDEAGVTGMADPFNRKTYPWGEEDQRLLAAFRALGMARSQTPALYSGFCRMGALQEDVFAVIRYTTETDAFQTPVSSGAAVLLVNRSDTPRSISLCADLLPEGPDGETPVSLAGTWREVLTGTELYCDGEYMSLTLPAATAQLYIKI